MSWREEIPVNNPESITALLPPGWGAASGAFCNTALQQPATRHRLALTCGSKPRFHPGFSDSCCKVPSPGPCSRQFKAWMMTKLATAMIVYCGWPLPGIIHGYSPVPRPSYCKPAFLSIPMSRWGLWCGLRRSPFRAYYRWSLGHCWPSDLRECGKCLETFIRNWATAALAWRQQIKSKFAAMT